MNEADTVEIDDSNSRRVWFLTEAAGFMGAPRTPDRLLSRVAERMRRRTRPEQLISNGLFGLFRHGATAAIYLGLAYAAKLLFGIHRLQRPALSGFRQARRNVAGRNSWMSGTVRSLNGETSNPRPAKEVKSWKRPGNPTRSTAT